MAQKSFSTGSPLLGDWVNKLLEMRGASSGVKMFVVGLLLLSASRFS
jgi:hypothetical protein